MKELRVSAINNGTVIDHLPPKTIFKIVDILRLNQIQNEVLIGSHLKSGQFGKKGVIKITNVQLDQKAIDAVALLAKEATISDIKNYEVASKYKVKIPDQAVGIIKCFNPNCITNHEAATTKFTVLDKESLTLLCHYCEKITNESDLTFL
jgi:aspartate carbamoyltransferase regulatory subunit